MDKDQILLQKEAEVRTHTHTQLLISLRADSVLVDPTSE